MATAKNGKKIDKTATAKNRQNGNGNGKNGKSGKMESAVLE